MSSLGRLKTLRERNKHLLEQLSRQREALARQKREREETEDLLICLGEDSSSARAALAKHADPGKRPNTNPDAESPPSVPTHSGDIAGPSGEASTRPQESADCLENRSKRKGGAVKHVRFQTECEAIPETKPLREPSLLGYDWIAGVLDAEDSSKAHSDEYLNELRSFRSHNKDECVHSTQEEFSEERDSLLPQLKDTKSPDADTDTHQCTFSYRINNRLFPEPLKSPDCCPVCGLLKSSHAHTLADPALVRTDLPLCTLYPPYKHKPHRRGSFDPSDSLGLPAHCLSGWSNSVQSLQPCPSNLDLRSNVVKKSFPLSPQRQSPPKVLEAPAVRGGARHKSSPKTPQRHKHPHRK
ncbi:migration and invasion-inhibitory protein isoform X1 [Synchiropus splendidus]|uniref:migration and invasion-inhibitory protein isoform X1 n=1 Tax=Synchiropus splendidus TaxID=270530 RepID=UPI00237D558E|nr:migration and invasion-inhibitory protein isoform X1 [Synchiropus splendidus]